MGQKNKVKKPKKKKAGPKKHKRERLSKIRGDTPNPKERRTKLRG